MDRRTEYIEALISSLEHVLSTLDGDSSELGGADDPILQECEKAFELYREEAERFGPESRSAELKERIVHAVKLHALVIASAKREKESIGENLEGSSHRRQRREAFKTPPRIGGSCDMAG